MLQPPCSDYNTIKRCKPYLGTYVEISVMSYSDENRLLDISEEAFEEIARIESLMSFHNPQSELSRINQEAHKTPIIISAEMTEILLIALELSRLSDGAFDITIAPHLIRNGLLPNHLPKQSYSGTWKDIELHKNTVFFKRPLLIDLGGIAKGYAVDSAYEAIDNKVDNVIINAGGDLRMKRWQGEHIALKTPARKSAAPAVQTPLQASAVATSAGYYTEKISHRIISPFTQKSIKEKRSISVFAPTCALADALTKIVSICPQFNHILHNYGASAMALDKKGRIST